MEGREETNPRRGNGRYQMRACRYQSQYVFSDQSRRLSIKGRSPPVVAEHSQPRRFAGRAERDPARGRAAHRSELPSRQKRCMRESSLGRHVLYFAVFLAFFDNTFTPFLPLALSAWQVIVTTNVRPTRQITSPQAIEWCEHATMGDPFLDGVDITAGVDAAWTWCENVRTGLLPKVPEPSTLKLFFVLQNHRFPKKA